LNKETKGMLIGGIGIFIFALTVAITKIAVETFSPSFIVYGRGALGGTVALIYLLIRREPIPAVKHFKFIFIVGLMVIYAYPMLMTTGMTFGSSSHAAVILGLMPLLTAVVGSLRTKEKPSLGFWVVAVLGSMVVIIYSLVTGAGEFSRLDILLLFAAISAAIGYTEGALLSAVMDPKVVISWVLVAFLPVSYIGTMTSFQIDYLQANHLAWLCFSYLGLFSMYIGFFFWYEGLRIGGIARVSQVQLIQPFIILLSSSLFLGDSLTMINLVFASLVISTVILSRKMMIKRQK